MIQLMLNHGLRVTELISLQRNDIFIDGDIYCLNINRIKNGISSMHPLLPIEIALYESYLKCKDNGNKLLLFNCTDSMVQHLCRKIKKILGFPYLHPHMFRHTCGYRLVNNGISIMDIKDYLGHVSITNTIIYTHLDNNRFPSIAKVLSNF